MAKIKLSLPTNIFDSTHREVQKLEGKKAKFLSYLADEKDPLVIQHWKRQLAIKNSRIKFLKQKMDALYDYMILRGAIRQDLQRYPVKEFCKMVAKELNLSINEVTKKRRNILKFGYAVIEGKWLKFLGHDQIWKEFFDLLIGERSKITGQHERLGVYKIKGFRKVHFSKGHVFKNGKKAKRDFTKKFARKVEVKILKIEVEKSQLNKKELKKQFALALIKHWSDIEATKQVKKSDEENPCKVEKIQTELTCEYIAKKVGYLTAASGMYIRRELVDTGFISIKENKVIVKANCDYKQGAEEFSLYQGIQSDTGMAYFWANNNVYGVSCYQTIANGYNPIIYPFKKSVKKPRKRYIPWKFKMLAANEGLSMKRIFAIDDYLFEGEGQIPETLWYMLDNNYRTFTMETFLECSEKLGFKTNLQGCDEEIKA